MIIYDILLRDISYTVRTSSEFISQIELTFTGNDIRKLELSRHDPPSLYELRAGSDSSAMQE